MPVVLGNTIELFGDSQAMVDRLTTDINAATAEINLLYYILCPDSTGRQIADALKAAAQRGVRCRLLVDAFASRFIFARNGLAEELRSAGVKVAQALPSSPLRRRDLRNHRKLAVIDNRLAFAGSQNLINPDYGGRRGAPWYDLTGRFTGPVVAEIAAVFASDWAFETNQLLDVPVPANIPMVDGGFPMQVVPTGPVAATESYRRVLLAAIQYATQRLVLTTPYFVPDDPTMVSLLMAADRGVEVTLIVPLNPDHFFAAAAGRSHYTTLLQAGVSIYLYKPGLLHTKAVTADDTLAIFGSANLDVRSFHLNFELSIMLYGSSATAPIRAAQQTYLAQSEKLDLQQWLARPLIKQYADEAVSLISPLL
jgi:cardiolipin synthase